MTPHLVLLTLEESLAVVFNNVNDLAHLVADFYARVKAFPAKSFIVLFLTSSLGAFEYMFGSVQ